MPQPSPEPNGLFTLPERQEPSIPEVRTEGFDGVQDIEALGRVASVIGHELTNVLQVLSNSIDRLADPAASGSAIVRMARASLERGVRLARQLQAFARVSPPRPFRPGIEAVRPPLISPSGTQCRLSDHKSAKTRRATLVGPLRHTSKKLEKRSF